MKFNGTSWRLAALVLAVSAGLGGCVGDGGKADVAEVVTGTVSDGMALANATVSITDSSRSDEPTTTVTTDENGRFSFRPGSRVYPFTLSVTSGNKQLFSIVLGSDRHVNINPASTIISQYALRASYGGTAVASSGIGKVTADQVSQAEQLYLQTVRADSPRAAEIFDISPRTKEFQPETATLRSDAYGEYLSLIDVSARQQDNRMVLLNQLPSRFSKVETRVRSGSDDLLTAGLDVAGVLGAKPAYSLPMGTDALRQLSVYNAYHALVDLTAAGGYGLLYGGLSKVPGTEYLAFADDGTGQQNISTLVQIPDGFNRDNPCILVIAAPGLRGVYSANPTAEWALKRGCVVAATDKGAGSGAEHLDSAEGIELDGRIIVSNERANNMQYRSAISTDARKSSEAKTPGRFGFKFAHSRQNPERNWGRNVLDASKLAFYLLNEKYGVPTDIGQRKARVIKPEQTLVIVTGDGEGAAAALAAAEQDQLRLVDGVVAVQPHAQLADAAGIGVNQGGGAVTSFGKPLLDYMTFANLYQPCAGLISSSAPGAALLDATAAGNRCSALYQKGLLTAGTLSGQVAESVQKLRAYGWQPESDVLHGASYMLKTVGAAMAYANAYGKFSVTDNLCGLSYGASDANGSPVQAAPGIRQQLFAESNGMPPYGAISLIYNDAANGNKQQVSQDKFNLGIDWRFAVSPSTGKVDYAFDTAYCLRSLALGKDPVSGAALSAGMQPLADAIKSGVAAASMSAALRGLPTVVVHGRGDSVFPVNHSSRPYVARSLATQGVSNRLRYYEVLNAQHFEGALATLGGFDSRYVPLRPYMLQSLDMMYEHLTLGKALPDSQVVRAVARGGSSGSTPAVTQTNVPRIAAVPAAADLIQFGNSTLSIPN